MKIKKVEVPEKKWIRPLTRLAENYRYEKKRRKLQKLDAAQHFRNSLKNRDNSFFIAALNKQPTGWLKITKNILHSRKLEREIYNASWELIAEDDNNIRAKLLNQAMKTVENKQIIFQQPAENKDALQLYSNNKTLTYAGAEILLYLLPEKHSQVHPLREGFELHPLTSVKRADLEELINQYEGGHLLGFPGYPRRVAKQLYRDWLLNLAPRATYHSRIITRGKKTVGIICTSVTDDSFPAKVKCGTIAYIQVHPDFTGKGLGGYLLAAGIEHLKSEGVQYLELKVNSKNSRAIKFYQREGFQEITKRIYYTNVP